MGEVGGSRHFDGRTPAIGSWRCPSCGQTQTGDLAKGCQACGSGTAAQAETAVAVNPAAVSHERILGLALRPEYQQSAIAEPALGCLHLTIAARWTIAAALAHYADHGSPTTAELPRVVTKAWALEMSHQLLAEEAGTALVVPDPQPEKETDR